MTPEEQRIDAYLRHITRLEARNRLLAECLADERRLRKRAYDWYRKRLMSRWWSFFDMTAMTWRES